MKTGIFTLFGDRWLCASCTEKKRALRAEPAAAAPKPPPPPRVDLVSEPAATRTSPPSTWEPSLVGARGFERSPRPPETFTVIDDPEPPASPPPEAPTITACGSRTVRGIPAAQLPDDVVREALEQEGANSVLAFPGPRAQEPPPGFLDDVVDQASTAGAGVESPLAELARGQVEEWRDAPEEKAARLALLGVKSQALSLRTALEGLDQRIADLEAALERRPRRRLRVPKVGARRIVNVGAGQKILDVLAAQPAGQALGVAAITALSGLPGKLVSEMCAHYKRKGKLERRPLANWEGKGRGCFEYWIPAAAWEPKIVLERHDLANGTVLVVECDSGFDRKVGGLLRAYGETWEVLGWDDHLTVGAPHDGERIAVRVRPLLTSEPAGVDDATKAAARSQEAEA
jgi:hypothetical protein